MIRTIILDDEIHATETLGYFIKTRCPNVDLLAVFNDALQAQSFLTENSIDLLILDIEMPRLNGFDLLKALQPLKFEVIFVTAYNEFALKAFRYAAFDYFLKPIDELELAQSINRLSKRKAIDTNQRLNYLMEMMLPQSKKPKKIALPTLEGFEFLDLDKIIRIESDSNYVNVFLTEDRHLLVCKTLKEMEETLSESQFIRVHNSHLVNLDFVSKYIKNGGGSLLTEDGFEVPISRLRKEFTFSKIKDHVIMKDI
jgi:two-component system, LytTR family, response regulator